MGRDRLAETAARCYDRRVNHARLGRNAPLFAGLLALAAWLALVATLDPNVCGPGMTCDEYYYAAHGKRLFGALVQQKIAFFRRESIEANFGPMHEHPPLAAFCLGAVHALFDARGSEPDAIWLPGARLASATALALTVFLAGWWTAASAGNLAGAIAGVALILMPRAFAHGHFAALDLLTAAFGFFAAATLFWATESPRTWRFVCAGVAWGLAMLCKFNGVLLAAPLALWMVVALRKRSAAPLVSWSATGAVVFFAGWPWLWPQPFARLAQFLASSTERVRLHNFYGGQAWIDIETPWHYPWVMTAVTIPIGLLALAAIGASDARRSNTSAAGRLARYVLLNVMILLAIFSLPGVPVYDGARLFVLVYPLVAVLVGLGASRLLSWWRLPAIPRAVALGVGALLLATQAWGVARYHPAQLSYYNALVGGLAGAERLGFEVNYWGDAVDRRLIRDTREFAAGETVLWAPSLAPWQVPAVSVVFPELARAGIELAAGDATDVQPEARYALVYRRRADEARWQPLVIEGRVVAENAIGRVWLARLYELTQEHR